MINININDLHLNLIYVYTQMFFLNSPNFKVITSKLRTFAPCNPLNKKAPS